MHVEIGVAPLTAFQRLNGALVPLLLPMDNHLPI